MGSNRKSRHGPGDVFWSDEAGEMVRIDAAGEETPFVPYPQEPFPDPPARDSLDDIPIRADGSVSPFYDLDHGQLERLHQDTPRTARVRRDGWTVERQTMFIETLAATASVSEACRYVGLSRQSAHKLCQRSPQFREAWDEALKAAVGVLAATAFDRAVNGTQEQVWHKGRMIGFREKYHDRLLLYLLRVRDPLNYAPLDDLVGWQRRRAIEDRSGGIAPVLDRLEAAERAWAAAQAEPPQLTAPADLLPAPPAPTEPPEPSAPPAPPEPPELPRPKAENTVTPSTSSTSPNPPASGARSRRRPAGRAPGKAKRARPTAVRGSAEASGAALIEIEEGAPGRMSGRTPFVG